MPKFTILVQFITATHIGVGDSMVSSGTQKKTHNSEFFKDYQNSLSPKDKSHLKSLKNSQVHVFPNCTRNHAITN